MRKADTVTRRKEQCEIGGKSIPLEIAESTPVFYRKMFNRDMAKDSKRLCRKLQKFIKFSKNCTEQEARRYSFDRETLIIYSRISYALAKTANPQTVPDSLDEWIDGIPEFPIRQVLPKVLRLLASFYCQTNSTNSRGCNIVKKN